MSKTNWETLLVYRRGTRRGFNPKAAYLEWRAEQGIAERCDNAACSFHTGPLRWNGKPLTMILDHCDGDRDDNTPENLRFICPNCHSQLPTYERRNSGRAGVPGKTSRPLPSMEETWQGADFPPGGTVDDASTVSELSPMQDEFPTVDVDSNASGAERPNEERMGKWTERQKIEIDRGILNREPAPCPNCLIPLVVTEGPERAWSSVSKVCLVLCTQCRQSRSVNVPLDWRAPPNT